MMVLATICVLILALSWALTWLMRRYALHRGLMDLPGSRSSHAVPTPRGGGLAICVTCMVGWIGWWVTTVAGVTMGDYALMGGTLLVAGVGLVDDFGHVPPRYRLIVHFLACNLIAVAAGGLPPIDFGLGPSDLGMAGMIVTVFALVWFLNLFNFMDGIDGIAALEAAMVALGAATLIWVGSGMTESVALLATLVAAVSGFMGWNWPPAKIFMGDVGSGFLGLALGGIALLSIAAGELTVWSWLILLGAFVADATVCVIRRAMRGVALAEAHRTHAYQRLTRRVGKHWPVTVAFGAINLLWLYPLAAFAALQPAWGFLLLLLAWAPLWVAAWLLGSGLPGELSD